MSVTEAGVLSSSVAVTTIVCAPTSALSGVPEITPAVVIARLPELGRPVALKVNTSPESASAKLLEMSRL